MGDLVYKTSLEISGPWLLSIDQLKALDDVLDENWTRLQKHHEQMLQQAVDREVQADVAEFPRLYPTDKEKRSHREHIERLRHSQEPETRSVAMVFGDGTRLSVATFREAILHPHVMRDVPIAFDVDLRCGAVECEVSLRSGFMSERLDLRVTPANSAIASTLFVALRHWAESAKAPKWQQIWRPLRPVIVMLLIAWPTVVVLLAGLARELGAKLKYQEQAAQLLKNGLSQGDQLKAIELILSFSADRFPNDQVTHFPGWLWVFAGGGLIILLILCFPPKIVLGIGKGETKLRRWRWWLRLVFYLVPAYLLTTFVWPSLTRIVTSVFFKH